MSSRDSRMVAVGVEMAELKIDELMDTEPETTTTNDDDQSNVEGTLDSIGEKFTPMENIVEGSAVSKVFADSSIIGRVFKNLLYSDLMNCSLVNREWNTQVSLSIRGMAVFKLSFKFSSNLFAQEFKGVKIKGNSGHAYYRLQSISQFHPFLQLEKTKEIWLHLVLSSENSTTLKGFLYAHRLSITRLALHAQQSTKMTPLDLYKMLEPLTNLEYLALWTLPHEWISCPGYLRRTQEATSPTMVKVHTLCLSNHESFYSAEVVRDLLQVFSNVRRIRAFPLGCIPELSNSLNDLSSTLEKIKSVDSSPHPIRATDLRVEQLKLLAPLTQQMKLKCLTISMEMVSTSPESTLNVVKSYESFSTILSASSPTLEKLTMEPLSVSELLRIPPLPSLKTLVFRIPKERRLDNNLRFLPRDLDVRSTFPTVVRVEIQSHCEDICASEYLFPLDTFCQDESSYFRSVRHLKICDAGDLTIDLVPRLAMIFPDVEILSCCGNRWWLEICLPLIWRLWPNLEELNLEIDLNSRVEEYPMRCWDEIFTGISEDRCRKIRLRGKDLDPSLVMDEHRSRAAVSTMSRLTRLRIILKSKYWTASSFGRSLLFTDLTARFGFHLVPGLEVLIGMPIDNEFKEELKSSVVQILPYVNFDR